MAFLYLLEIANFIVLYPKNPLYNTPTFSSNWEKNISFFSYINLYCSFHPY